MSYPQSIHHLLSTYATTNVIHEAGNSVRCLRQHRFSVQEYADKLNARARKCGDVFDDNELMGIFVEGLHEDIRRSVQHYWATHRPIRMHALVAYAVSIDTTRATRTRDPGTCGQKNHAPSSSARLAGCLSTAAGPPEALLVSHNDAQYPRSITQVYRSLVDSSDQSTYCRFCLEHKSSPTRHATRACRMSYKETRPSSRPYEKRTIRRSITHSRCAITHDAGTRAAGRVADLPARTTYTSTISSQKRKEGAVRLRTNAFLFRSLAAVR